MLSFTPPLFSTYCPPQEIPIRPIRSSHALQLTESTVYNEDYDQMQKEYVENEALKEREKFAVMLHEAKKKKDATNRQSPAGTIVSEEDCKDSSYLLRLTLTTFFLADHESNADPAENPATQPSNDQDQTFPSTSSTQVQGLCESSFMTHHSCLLPTL